MKSNGIFESLRPSKYLVSFAEKFLSAIAALFGMLLLGEVLRLLPDGGHPLTLFASMAAAAVLLYAAPHSPMAQPWPLVVGNLLSGTVGWLCGIYVSDPVLAAASAVGLSIFIMQLTNSLHAPGAATAMIMVLNTAQIHQYGWPWAAGVVIANVAFSLLFALALNKLIHTGRYPVIHHNLPTLREGVPPGELASEDIEWALGKMEGFIDVDEEDLLEIYRLATEHAQSK